MGSSAIDYDSDGSESNRTRDSFLRRGEQITSWIEDPSRPNCLISVTQLTAAQISAMADHEERLVPRDRDAQSVEEELILPHNFNPRPWIFWSGNVAQADSHQVLETGSGRQIISVSQTNLEGYFGKGGIVINIMKRSIGATSPHISELAVARYAEEFGMETLRYVFVSMIVNRDLRHYVDLAKFDEDALENGLVFPRGCREYFEFMGTRIGRVVGSILLAGFPRGTRRISHVVIWQGCGYASMRFDIEEM